MLKGFNRDNKTREKSKIAPSASFLIFLDNVFSIYDCSEDPVDNDRYYPQGPVLSPPVIHHPAIHPSRAWIDHNDTLVLDLQHTSADLYELESVAHRDPQPDG